MKSSPRRSARNLPYSANVSEKVRQMEGIMTAEPPSTLSSSFDERTEEETTSTTITHSPSRRRATFRRLPSRSEENSVKALELLQQYGKPPSADYNEPPEQRPPIPHDVTDESILSPASQSSQLTNSTKSVRSSRTWFHRTTSNRRFGGGDPGKKEKKHKISLSTWFNRDKTKDTNNNDKQTETPNKDDDADARSVRSWRSARSAASAKNDQMIADFFDVQSFRSDPGRDKMNCWHVRNGPRDYDNEEGDAGSVGTSQSMTSFLVYLEKREKDEMLGRRRRVDHDFEFDGVSEISGGQSVNDDEITLASGLTSANGKNDSGTNPPTATQTEKPESKSLLRRIFGRKKRQKPKKTESAPIQAGVARAFLQPQHSGLSIHSLRNSGRVAHSDRSESSITSCDLGMEEDFDLLSPDNALKMPDTAAPISKAHDSWRSMESLQEVGEDEKNHDDDDDDDQDGMTTQSTGEASEEGSTKRDRDYAKESHATDNDGAHDGDQAKKSANAKKTNLREEDLKHFEMYRMLLQAQKKNRKKKGSAGGQTSLDKMKALEESRSILKSITEEEDEESALSLLSGLLTTWATERLAAQNVGAQEGRVDGLTLDPPSNMKSCLKGDSRVSSTTGEGAVQPLTRGPLKVGFDRIQVRLYERVVGDNPACTAGPPISIGWAYSFDSDMRVDEYENARPVRRCKREFHLKASVRTDMLRNEWCCKDEDIRRARREAAYVQYCREKTAFSGSRKKEAMFLKKGVGKGPIAPPSGSSTAEHRLPSHNMLASKPAAATAVRAY